MPKEVRKKNDGGEDSRTLLFPKLFLSRRMNFLYSAPISTISKVPSFYKVQNTSVEQSVRGRHCVTVG